MQDDDKTRDELLEELRDLRSRAAHVAVATAADSDAGNWRRRLDEVAAGMQGVVYRVERDPGGATQMTFISESCREIYGLEPKEAIADISVLWDMIVPEDLQMFKDVVRRSESTLKPWKLDYRIVDRRGRLKWLRGISYPRREAGGCTVWNGFISDITDWKQIERELLDSQRFIHRIAESMPGLLTVYDLVKQRHVFTNGRITEILGYTLEELRRALSAGPESLLHPDDTSEVRSLLVWLETAKDGEIYESRYRMKAAGGGYRWLACRGTILERQADGSPRLYLTVAMDVTDQVNLESQVIQSQKMEAVGRLAGGVAHDFNNILTVIRGYSSLLEEELPSTSPSQEKTRAIIRSAERAEELTRQLLAFGRKQRAEVCVTDLNKLLSEHDTVLRRTIGEDIELTTVLDPELGAVLVDPGHIDQVIFNLAINARDAMPSGGKLTVTTSNLDSREGFLDGEVSISPGRYVVIQVQDTGHGMDELTMSHAFEPFFTTKEAGKGTGLGLSAVYGIVEQADGSISLNSTPGGGTTFRVYLPRIEACVHESGTRKSEPATAHKTGTILLVEDDDDLRRLVVTVLGNKGYNVMDTADPRDAIERLRNFGSVDLILTDVVMPGLSGPEMVEKITEIQPKPKVLYISGYADKSRRARQLIEDNPLLEKPFTPAALLERVSSLMRSGS